MKNTLILNKIDTYINEYGETWHYEIDEKYNNHYVWCDDSLIYKMIIPVTNGKISGTVLTQSEKDWIYKTWRRYVDKKQLDWHDDLVGTLVKKYEL